LNFGADCRMFATLWPPFGRIKTTRRGRGVKKWVHTLGADPLRDYISKTTTKARSQKGLKHTWGVKFGLGPQTVASFIILCWVGKGEGRYREKFGVFGKDKRGGWMKPRAAKGEPGPNN